MNDSNRKTGNVNRRSATGMGLCVSGMLLLAWPIVSLFVGGDNDPAVLFVALPILIGVGLIVAGFAMMVAGAEPFEEDDGEFRDAQQRESSEST